MRRCPVVSFGSSAGILDALESRRLLATVYVDLNAPTGTNDGTSWSHAYKNLHLALSNANPGDSIRVANGTYKPTSGADRTIAFQLKSGVSLYGSYAGYGASNPNYRNVNSADFATTLSGEIGSSASSDNSYHVLMGEDLSQPITLDGFKIRSTEGGVSAGADKHGAIHVTSVKLNLRNMTFSGNEQGIYFSPGYHDGGHLKIRDSRFESNTRGIFSGWLADESTPIVIENSQFRSNGIGISATDQYWNPLSATVARTFTIKNSIFDGNDNGAQLNTGGVVTDSIFTNHSETGLSLWSGRIEDCKFTDNAGLALYVDSGALVADSLFKDNQQGAMNYNGSLFFNCTFINNPGGGIEQHMQDDSVSTGIDQSVFVASSVMIRSGSVTNSVFIGCSTAISIRHGGAWHGLEATISNNTFYGNTADVGSVISHSMNDDSSTKLIFEMNIALNNGGSLDVDSFVPAQNEYFNAPDPVVKNSVIDDGYPNGVNILTTDPQFIQTPDAGADEIWGTTDDDLGDLHLQSTSPILPLGWGAYGAIYNFAREVDGQFLANGTSGNDTLTVTSSDTADTSYYDFITFTLNGKSVRFVDGDASNSIKIETGAGRDLVEINQFVRGIYANGGAGNDTIKGGSNKDTLSGGSGRNQLYGNAGDDLLNGGNSNDALFGGDGNDRLNGNDGSDYLEGNKGSDRAYGGQGNDTIRGHEGNDKLYGESGSDWLYGDAGADLLNGGSGADRSDNQNSDTRISIEILLEL